LGVDATDDEIEQSRQTYDQNGDGYIDFREFARMAVQVRRQSLQRTAVSYHDLTPEEEQLFKEQFKKFDADNSGTIDRAELDTMLTTLNFKHSSEDLDAITNDMDKDGDGTTVNKHFYWISLLPNGGFVVLCRRVGL
jgi:Ca2+-binding EF-hand superfamily protein